MSDRALIVFVKHPEPGRVKTRLVPELGAEAAAALYRALAEGVLEATAPRGGEYETLVFFDPSATCEAIRGWLPGVRLWAQTGDDLGERMTAAFERAFRRGARRVALIGTDAPAVTHETVAEALSELDRGDVVVGPAEDGGYYLLALREPHPEVLAEVPWSTPGVLDQTLARAAGAGLTVRCLGRLRDVDTFQDVRSEWPRLRPLLEGHVELLRRVEARLALP